MFLKLKAKALSPIEDLGDSVRLAILRIFHFVHSAASLQLFVAQVFKASSP